jgi:flagellar biogenesis protein FliO
MENQGGPPKRVETRGPNKALVLAFTLGGLLLAVYLVRVLIYG